jgi:DNA invertase Pin-like site-specific DNA recombinase
MIDEVQQVTPNHLRRDAYLYIRQATIHAGVPNSGSLQRQYALHQKAIALGWPSERVVVIDCDLGQSGASTHDRKGFQRLIADVSQGRVGIVLTLDVSRLSRNCCDWHDLLEACASHETLVLVKDEVYDLARFDGRLLLGLSRPMSETDARLQCLPVHRAVDHSSNV